MDGGTLITDRSLSTSACDEGSFMSSSLPAGAGGPATGGPSIVVVQIPRR